MINYTVMPQITSLAVTAGPESGGTIVSVTGSGFIAAEPTCEFDTSYTMGTTLSATSLNCMSPTHAIGTTVLAVSNNFVDFSTNTPEFLYHGMPFANCCI